MHTLSSATSVPASDRRNMIESAFRAAFNESPSQWVRAPGRVELLGSDTDDHLGYVMTMAIDLDTWIAFRPRSGTRCRVTSINLGEQAEFELGREPTQRRATWDRYVNGVSQLLAERGIALRAVDAVVHSTIPLGGGLSSSAALQVAAAHMFLAAADTQLAPDHIARLFQQVEDRCVGVTCGLLDQYSSVFGVEGSALLLDCRSVTHVEVRIPQGISLVVCNTHVPRTLAGTQYAARRRECDEGTALLQRHHPHVRSLCDVTEALLPQIDALPSPQRDRCRFIAQENHRVMQLAAAFVRDDRPLIGSLLAASFSGFRDLYGKTVPEMEALHAIMQSAPGAIGARQMGGGWGGCLLGYVNTTQVVAFIECVAHEYGRVRAQVVTPHLATPSAGAGRFNPD